MAALGGRASGGGAPRGAWRRSVRRAVSALAIAGVLTGLSAGGVAAPSLTSTTTLRVSGLQQTGIDKPNRTGRTWNLRGAVWDENAPDPTTYPIRSEAWTRGTIIGGAVYGNVPKRWTRDQWYDAEDGGRRMGGEAFRQTLTDTRRNYLVIRDAYVEDYEDAFDPNSRRRWRSTTRLKHVWAKNIRDDCLENEDRPHNVVIRNSLLDGCFTAFAERPKGAGGAVRNGSGPQFLRVIDSLVWVKPMPLGRNYCSAALVREGRCKRTSRPGVWLGAYGIWKWSRAAASRVTVRNTVFRLDMPSYSSHAPHEWPRGTYENVTLVWTGRGPYASAGGWRNVVPKGVRVTKDIRVWRRAKSRWRAQW
jgi:hypothetical protein